MRQGEPLQLPDPGLLKEQAGGQTGQGDLDLQVKEGKRYNGLQNRR